MGALLDIVILLVILVGLVLVHELGHFVTAKRAGVKVHEFGIGFPPRAAVLFRRGETTYSLNWLPIGGFVRLEGEEGESLDARAFVNQKLGRRLIILVAGVVVNFVLAWLIFTLIAFAAEPTWKVRLGHVLPDSPAEAAGLVGGIYTHTDEIEVEDADGVPTGEIRYIDRYDDSGELIVAIDGRTFGVFDDLLRADGDGRITPLTYLSDRPAETVTLTIEDAGGEFREVQATLRTAAEIEQELGALGFTQGTPEFGRRGNGLVESVGIGLEQTVRASTLILRGLGEFIVSLFAPPEGEAPPPISGPVGIVSVIGIVRDSLPPVFMLFFVGLLSANLAIINALPFPPLDGGRITMALLQAVSRNGISPAAERMVYLTGFVLLMVLLVFVTVGDISRLVA